MENKREISRVYYIIALLISFLFAAIIINNNEKNSISYAVNDLSKDPVTLSYTSGIYESDLYISLSLDNKISADAKVYFTIDGNDPDDSSYLYDGNAIYLGMNEEGITTYPLKIVVYENEKFSKVYSYTYVLGSNIKDNLDLPIISITTNYDNLYDEETGIFYPDNVLNRTDEWIREGNITYLDITGNTLFNENIGMQVSGATSSKGEVKSLKITFNKEYGSTNNYVIYNGFTSNEYKISSNINKYNKLKLRSGGQDINVTNIRSDLTSTLALEAGYLGVYENNRSIVYLNGNFYGIFDIEPSYTATYLSRKFDLDDKEAIEKFEGSEKEVLESSGLTKYFKSDLTKKDNQDALESVVDMDDYLMYYAINVLLKNTDWPDNNYQAWRYNGEQDKNNKYTDGRLRFLIKDPDLIYYSEDLVEFFDGAAGDNLEALLTNTVKGENSLFSNVIKSNKYKYQFINILLDLMNTTFTKENVLSKVDESYSKITNANKLFFTNEYINQLENNINSLKNEVINRNDNIYELLDKYLDLDIMHDVCIRSSEGVLFQVSNINIYENQEYHNSYYDDVNLVIKATSYRGYNLDYILVNGKKYNTNEIILTNKDIVNGKIIVEASTSRNNDELLIKEISAKSDADFYKFINVSDHEINIDKYYISDDVNNLLKYQLPSHVLKPGESVVINGKKNYYAIGDYISNFSLNHNETIYLYLKDENKIVDSIDVPIMSEKETFGRLFQTDNFVFYNNSDGSRKR